MTIAERVENALKSLDLKDPQVRVDPSESKVVVHVVSCSFQPMPEADRQRMVWGKLLDELDDEEQRLVEFVFTDSPDEVEAVAVDG